MNRDDIFLKKEYNRNLLAIMLSVLGGTVNTFIDSAFVSQRLGSDGLAAVNMSMPVYLILCTLGALISRGTSILSAQASGEDDTDKAGKYYHTGIALSLVCGAAVTVMGIFLARPAAELLSHGGALTESVYDYSLVTFIGSIPAIFMYIPVAYLQIDGKTGAISAMMAVMVAADCLLDWIFLFIFDLGIAGASWASVISMLLACVFGAAATERGFSNYHFDRKKLGLYGLSDVIKYGTPGAVGNFVDAVRMLILNSMILSAAGNDGVAVWAVLNTFCEISMAVTSGVPLAAAPMTGVYYRSKENSGIRILNALQYRTGMLMTAGFALILVIFHSFFEMLFASPQDLTVPLLCLGIFIILDLVCNIWIVFFNSTGRNALSTLIVLLRKLIMPVGAAKLLIILNGYLWLFMPLGGLFTVIIGIAVIGAISFQSRKLRNHRLSGFLLLDDYLERENKVLDFSIPPDMEDVCAASERIQDFCAANDMDARQTNRLGLVIEELLGVIIQKNPDIRSVDLRAYALDDITGIRLRCAGRRYNPFEESGLEEDEMLMGIMMLNNMADMVNYTYTLGMNTINITFDR